jgi:8-oxo-dGTP diphosphatase
VLKALALPEMYAISNAEDVGEQAFLATLTARLAEGLRLVQVRDKALPRDRRLALAGAVVALARRHEARVLVNDDAALAAEVGADGVHFSARALRALTARPACDWIGASVHDADELRRAESVGCDFAVLGPVRPTATHPSAAPLGWDGFTRRVAAAAIPVFALGGLAWGDLETARRHGGHGVAMIRGAWRR